MRRKAGHGHSPDVPAKGLQPRSPSPGVPARECDLVMEGGITSGVVYPRAAVEIAKTYRLRRLGGTSAGAIAAAAAAAAERHRLHAATGQSGSSTFDGFERLEQLAEDLARPHPRTGRTVLRELFVPQRGTRRLFDLVASALERAPVRAVLLTLLRQHGPFLPLLLLGVLLLAASSVLLTSLLVLVAAYLWRRPPPQYGERSVRRMYGWFLGKGELALLAVLVVGMPAAFWGYLLGSVPRGDLWNHLVYTTVWGVALVLIGAIPVVLTLYRQVFVGLRDNDFGLCTGSGADTRLPPARRGDAFTDWLTGKLDDLAGLLRGVDQAPLTFRHLWQPSFQRGPWGPGTVHDPDVEPARLNSARDQPTGFGDARARPAVDLRLVTTCLSLHRPFVFPLATVPARPRPRGPLPLLTGGTPHRQPYALYIAHDDLVRFFPERVAAYVQAHATDVRRAIYRRRLGPATRVLYGLPHPWDLPVVFAVRLSMSFPGLFSAVPLYVEEEPPLGERVPRRGTLRRVLFSDGGLTSNFPLMLFDDLLPDRPLFALDLEYTDVRKKPGEGEQDRVRLLRHPEVPWPRRVFPSFGLPAYLGSIVESARLWGDNILMNMPGHRDRITKILVYAGEGGLNLNMTPERIRTLAERGAIAGQNLADRFHPDVRAASEDPEWWEHHVWTRFNLAMLALEELTRDLGQFQNLTAFRSAFAKSHQDLPGYARATSSRNLLEMLSHLRQFQARAERLRPRTGVPLFQKSAPGPRQDTRYRAPLSQ